MTRRTVRPPGPTRQNSNWYAAPYRHCRRDLVFETPMPDAGTRSPARVAPRSPTPLSRTSSQSWLPRRRAQISRRPCPARGAMPWSIAFCDAYADLQPAWSPDGATLVFATDRFTTDLDALRPGVLRLAAIDLVTSAIRELPGTPGGRNFSPRFGRGDELFFVADPDGSPGVYRTSLSGGEALRVTPPGVEVIGLTPSGPALSATRGGTIAFSFFRDGRYQVALVRP